MSDHTTHASEQPSIWSLLNVILAALFSLTVLGFGGMLFLGGIASSTASRAPKVAPPPASPTAAAAPAAASAPAAATAAPAAPVAFTGPALEVTIKPDVANPMMFNTKEISAKAGQKIKLTFDNKGAIAPLQHNVVVGTAGSKDKLIALSAAIMTDPNGMAKGYIPEAPEILAHTKLVNPGSAETIEFTLPSPGDYPFMCTFPGHSMIMNGTIKVQ